MNNDISQKATIRVAEYYSNSDIRIKNIPMPVIGDNEILVQMQACGICGTDVMEWYRKKTAPKVLGHEMSGLIKSVGKNINEFNINDRVFVSHHVPCFNCFYCDQDKHSACNSLHAGNFFPGGFSEYIRVPEENVKFGTFVLPDEMTFDEATMIEPMACAVAGQKMVDIKENDLLIILGSGISGLCHLQLAKNQGARTITTDISDHRIKQAKNFGSDYSFKANELSAEIIRELNDGRLADKVIVCTGNENAIKDAFNFIDKKGQVLLFAVPPNDLSIPSTLMWRNEISIFFSYGAATYDISDTIKLCEEKKINLRRMISHQMPLSEIVNGFKLTEEAQDSIKVVIKPDNLI